MILHGIGIGKYCYRKINWIINSFHTYYYSSILHMLLFPPPGQSRVSTTACMAPCCHWTQVFWKNLLCCQPCKYCVCTGVLYFNVIMNPVSSWIVCLIFFMHMKYIEMLTCVHMTVGIHLLDVLRSLSQLCIHMCAFVQVDNLQQVYMLWCVLQCLQVMVWHLVLSQVLAAARGNKIQYVQVHLPAEEG